MTALQPIPLVLLAGVPGAGKTEALKMISKQAPWVRISDSETVRSRLSNYVPWLPYTMSRPVVHTIGHFAALFQVLRRDRGPLIVHDPGTRHWSRRLLLRLALLRGHRPVAVYIDIDRESAILGQVRRGRVVRHQAFERHWRHWVELRKAILAGVEPSPGERWPRMMLSSRDSAVDDLHQLLDSTDCGQELQTDRT
ncbi:MAG: AAA family ATPase [Brevibacterium aurantiacum]